MGSVCLLSICKVTNSTIDKSIKHLTALKEGKKEKVEKEIEDMIRKGKTNRDFIDFSINLFDSM